MRSGPPLARKHAAPGRPERVCASGCRRFAVPLLVLKAISLDRLHGYGVLLRIRRILPAEVHRHPSEDV